MPTVELSDEVIELLNKQCRLGENADGVLKRLLKPKEERMYNAPNPQNKESGIEAYRFGLTAARQIADEVGAEPIPDDPANMFMLDGVPTLIKTRRSRGGVFSIPDKLFDRFENLLAAVGTSETGVFDLYMMPCKEAIEHSYEGRSKRNPNQKRLAVKTVVQMGEKQATVHISGIKTS